MQRLWRQDLAWAAYILGLAVLIGLLQQWPLVRQSWQGELTAALEQARSQRRQEEFQGVKTINLAQAYALFQKKQALFIDARPADEYAELHIPKALNITPEMLDNAGAAGKWPASPKTGRSWSIAARPVAIWRSRWQKNCKPWDFPGFWPLWGDSGPGTKPAIPRRRVNDKGEPVKGTVLASRGKIGD